MRRLRGRASVTIDTANTVLTSSLRQFHGKRAIAIERLKNGDWVVEMGKQEIIIPRRFIRLAP